jgi:hypothetical protein
MSIGQGGEVTRPSMRSTTRRMSGGGAESESSARSCSTRLTHTCGYVRWDDGKGEGRASESGLQEGERPPAGSGSAEAGPHTHATDGRRVGGTAWG